MPKQTDRRFPNLLRAFGVLGAGQGDDLRLPVAGACSPVVSVDDYDPPAVYGASRVEPGVAGNFAFVEIKARPFARVLLLTPSTNPWQIRRLPEFSPTGVAIAPVLAFPFSSNGTLPKAEMRSGVAPALLGGVAMTLGAMISLGSPFHWEGVLRFETAILGGTIGVNFLFQEQRDA